MKKVISVLLVLLIFLNYGCGPNIYEVVYDGKILNEKPIKEISDISVAKRENGTKNVAFNVEGNFVYRYPKFSDVVTKKTVKVKYNVAKDLLVEMFMLGVFPVTLLVAATESGEVGERQVKNETIFKEEQAIVSKKLYKPKVSKEMVKSFMPFYSAVDYYSNKRFKVKRERVPLSSVYSGSNVGKTKELPKADVPIRFYYGKRFIHKATCADNINLDIEEYAKDAFLNNQESFEIKAVVGDGVMNRKGVYQFYYNFSTREYMPEYRALTESINSFPAGALVYAGESKDNLKLIGKTPYVFTTEKGFDNSLDARYYQIKKKGYRTSGVIYSSKTSDDRNISVNLEKIYYGYLNLSSRYSNVKIYIDGNFNRTYKGGNSSSIRLAPGSYMLTAKKAGFHEFKRRVVVGKETRNRINIDLQKIEFGFLKITSTSGNIKIFVDNKFKFEMSGGKPKYIKLEEGHHSVKAIGGNGIEERSVVISPKGNESISF